MINKLRVRAQSESGFTLVELLVVMLILGLLAAIAIPAFFNQRDKANDSDAKASVRTAQTAMETFATDNDGAYTGATAAQLETIEPTLNDAPNEVVVEAAGPESYIVSVDSETTTEFQIERTASGEINYTCNRPNEGGCPANQSWE